MAYYILQDSEDYLVKCYETDLRRATQMAKDYLNSRGWENTQCFTIYKITPKFPVMRPVRMVNREGWKPIDL